MIDQCIVVCAVIFCFSLCYVMTSMITILVVYLISHSGGYRDAHALIGQGLHHVLL